MSLMNYSTLIADKSTVGSIANFLSYTKLTTEVPIVLDEAQTLLMTLLRIREMRTKTRFTMPVNSAAFPVPSNFLDPIGSMFVLSYNFQMDQKDQSYVALARNYNETYGTLGNNPFTTTIGSTSVNVFLVNHGFAQESSFYTTGATTFNGVSIVGTFDITSIVDSNNFIIDITPIGVVPTGAGSGGGTPNYTCDNLVGGTPLWWAVWDEKFHFDQAFDQQSTCELEYFKSLPPLSLSNQTNVLTNRYPHLLRPACQVRAAAWMKDTETYQRELEILTSMTQAVSVENDMGYRGAIIDTEIP